MSVWVGKHGEVVSDRLPADPGLMGCGVSGPGVVVDERGAWTVCVLPALHGGPHHFRPLGHLEPK